MSPARTMVVVSTNWLREQIGNTVQKQASRKLRILDTSLALGNRKADSYTTFYKKGHIPQSVHFDVYTCTKDDPGLKVGFPDLNCFTDYAQSLGVWPDTHVVAYDRFETGFGPIGAFRTWWQFRAFGHRNVSVLDGGLQKWISDGFDVTTEEPEIERSNFEAKIDKNLIRNYEDMLANMTSRNEQIVDARPFDHPSVQDKETGGGCILGSKHVSFPEMFSADGTVKSDTELKTMFTSAGVDLKKPMVASCLVGLAACGTAAAAEILGKENVPVYEGSWEEFGRLAPEEFKGKGQQ